MDMLKISWSWKVLREIDGQRYCYHALLISLPRTSITSFVLIHLFNFADDSLRYAQVIVCAQCPSFIPKVSLTLS